MSKGFICLPRNFFNTPTWQKKRKFTPTEAWVDLLRRASYAVEPCQYTYKNTTVTYGYGEQCTSVRYLAVAWQWNVKAVGRFLHELERNGFLTVRSTGPNTPHIIRILTDGETPFQLPAAPAVPDPTKAVKTPTKASKTPQKPSHPKPLWPENPNPGLPGGLLDQMPEETLYVVNEKTVENASPQTAAEPRPIAPKETPRGTARGTAWGTAWGKSNPLSINVSDTSRVPARGTAWGTARGTAWGTNKKNKEENEKKKITPYVVIREEKTPPTLEMLKTCCRRYGLTAVDPEHFYAYYAARGWMMGRVPMADWRAALRCWNANTLIRQTMPSAGTGFSRSPAGPGASGYGDFKDRANRDALNAYEARRSLRRRTEAHLQPDF